jgi:phosphoribosylglycinamide formyltransferase-1
VRLVILASGVGSLARALFEAQAAGKLRAHIAALGSDRDCPAVQIAKEFGVATFVVPITEREHWDRALTQTVALFKPDLVVSAGFMRILGPSFLARFQAINSHPALLPAFPGAHAVRDALAARVETTGCTVHWIDAGTDTGRVIAQAQVPVQPGDTVATLHERIKAVERPLLVDTINSLQQVG